MSTPRTPDAPGRYIPVAVRRYVLARDGYTCHYCGVPATDLDHIMPWGQGGSHDPHNLVTCCTRCNSVAGDRVFGELSEKEEYMVRRLGEMGAWDDSVGD
jgi:5-methylcytosine-specific restriction endonuclease McrA